jgi:YhcH/YjgK/YiaL family protein
MVIFTTLGETNDLEALGLENGGFFSQRMARALQFLRAGGLESLEAGSIVHIEGDAVFAQVQAYITVAEDRARYETHDRYYDLHFMVEGREYFYYTDRRGLLPAAGYDREKDSTFYDGPLPGKRLLLTPGALVIVSPSEAHKPRVEVEGPGAVKKIVIKVAVY